jgi:hypothetical protein
VLCIGKRFRTIVIYYLSVCVQSLQKKEKEDEEQEENVPVSEFQTLK